MVAAVGAPSLAQEAYPKGQIKLVVPYSAGAVTDMLGRLVAKNLQESMGVTVIVENRTGAGGTLGSDYVAKSAPDGLTLLLGATGPVSVGKALYPKLPYDPAKDLTPVAIISRVPFVVVAHPSQPFKTIQDVIAAAKAKPNEVTYGSAGNGTPQHIIGEMFKQATGTELSHIPYKGSAPATVDLLSNQIAIMFDNPGPLVQHIKGGRLKALAQTGPTRLEALPNVPTMMEAGLKDFVATPWYGIMAPGNLPAPIAERLNKEINAALRKPDVVAKLADAGLTTSLMSLAEAKAFLAGEAKKWGDAARKSNATVD
jgi:tripartite-type tricarboxylate transporter receptor subunit TctC